MRAGGAFAAWLADLRPDLERALDRALPGTDLPPRRLHEAMRYSVFAGGKRLRPALVVLAGELGGAPRPSLVEAAVAVELVHTYSLIHDDLPALDDDDLRRGRPTLHKAFDEATAILAGDALLTLGLTRLAEAPAGAPEGLRARAVALVGTAIGTGGMIGGQMEDVAAEAAWPADPAAALDRIHRGKTGALLAACLRLGGLHAGVGPDRDATLGALGERLGLIFQIRDDLLDVEGTAGELGKTPGKDARAAKLTFPALHGVAASRQRLAALAAEAKDLAASCGEGAKLLTSLVVYLEERTS
jgi:geranylgeranyl pyrophosphate synthase